MQPTTLPDMSITITLTDPRSIDGVIATVNRQNADKPPSEHVTPQQFMQNEMDNLAKVFADYEKIAIMTSLGFVQRFTPEEYATIRAAAEQNPDVAGLVHQLIEAQTVNLADPRIPTALALLTASGLLAPGRAEQIVAWERLEFVEVLQP
jgi:hypothetical protein